MTRYNLDYGMVVVLNNGNIYKVGFPYSFAWGMCIGRLKEENEAMCEFFPLAWYNDDLTYKGVDAFSICKVYKQHDWSIKNPLENATRIWERSEKQTIKIFDREIEFSNNEIEELKKQLI